MRKGYAIRLMPLDFFDVGFAEEDTFDFAIADDEMEPSDNISDFPQASESPELISDLSDLLRKSSVHWGHADQPGVGRDKGNKIRKYSSQTRSDWDDEEDELDELESEYVPGSWSIFDFTAVDRYLEWYSVREEVASSL